MSPRNFGLNFSHGLLCAVQAEGTTVLHYIIYHKT